MFSHNIIRRHQSTAAAQIAPASYGADTDSRIAAISHGAKRGSRIVAVSHGTDTDSRIAPPATEPTHQTSVLSYGRKQL